jgi:hypothetical protein
MLTIHSQLFVDDPKDTAAAAAVVVANPVFTTATSSAVGPAPRAEEPWLTQRVRELFWLPVAVFVPHFDAVPPRPLQPVHFHLMSKFAPPKGFARRIRHFSFSLFSQGERVDGLPCCRASAAAAAECLRIYEPVLRIRVELTGLLARLHQYYPFTTFAVIFAPTWLVVFSAVGAILFGGAAMMMQNAR